MNSPCLKCTRVANPRDCEDKNCKAWRAWFVGQWDALRLQPRLQIERSKPQPEGVNIGGVKYNLPHRVRNYLDNDPCADCLCPKDLCRVPCRVKRAWKQAKEDVFLS